MVTLYIIRHGETDWNKAGRLQGQTNIPLNANGIHLAEQTGEGLKDVPFDLAISSPLDRVMETARQVLRGRIVPVIPDERIEEISFGDWEGENIRGESKILPVDFWQIFKENPAAYKRPPHGENFADVLKRTGELYRDLCTKPEYQGKTILISSHGCASRCFLNHFFEDKEDVWRGGVPKNCAVSIAKIIKGVGKVEELDHIYYE